MFENRYTITEKIYVDWTVRPVLLSRSRRRIPILPSLLLVACSVMLVMAVHSHDWKYAGLYGLLLACVAFRLFGYEAMLARRQFRRLRAQKADQWRRVLRFTEEGITVEDDGETLAEKTYEEVQEVRDAGAWLALIFQGGVVVRADKQGFFQGEEPSSQEAFLAFFRAKCPEAKFPA